MRTEQLGGKLRGAIDFATGRYPRFLFGAPARGVLPVFHFHEVEPETLEQQFDFLRRQGYRSVTSAVIERVVRGGEDPPPASVALTFDDAWSSLWTVAYPLLMRFDLTAIAYAIPARIRDTDAVRPTIDDPSGARLTNAAETDPFVTRGELQKMHREGIVDVQSHTYSHALIPVSPRIRGFLAPETPIPSLLSLPVLGEDGRSRFVTPSEFGTPLHPARSRMSGARRFIPDPEVRTRCLRYVAERGGARFFETPHWETELRELVGYRASGRFESDPERHREMLRELTEARRVLMEWLDTDRVLHLCFPWGVACATARSMACVAGYRTAFADRWFGYRAVRRGDDPFSLMRLPDRYVFRLPPSRIH